MSDDLFDDDDDEPIGGGGGGGGGGRGGKPSRGCSCIVVVILILLGLAALAGNNDGSTDGSAPSSPSSSNTAPEREEYEALDGGFTSDPTPTPVPDPEPTPDPVLDAEVGDCFALPRTPDDSDLEPAACGDGVFEVVDVITRSTDPQDCVGYGDANDTDWAINYGADDLTLCLGYQHDLGSAYHAEEGDCVDGSLTEGSRWEVVPCETGNLTVVDRIENESSWEDCDRSALGYYGKLFTVDGWQPELHVRLCLRMNYPDDAGLAHVDNCLLMTGPEDSPDFAFVDCGIANVYVSGRTSDYADAAFCDSSDGWAAWRPNHFPELAYTICWRWR